LKDLLSLAFQNQEIKKKNYTKIFIQQIPLLKKIIKQVVKITSLKVKDRRHLAQLFSEQYKYVNSFANRRDTEVYYRFIQGSLNYFQSNIMTNVYLYSEKQQQLDYIDFSLKLFHEHLYWLYDHLIKNYKTLSNI